jgi:hypothetical protein
MFSRLKSVESYAASTNRTEGSGTGFVAVLGG